MNPADADDARPWGAFEFHSSKICNSSPRATGQAAGARVLMMLAGWPLLGSSTAAPKPVIAWGMAAKRVRVPRGLRARSRAAQWKNEGPMKHGRLHRPSWLFANAQLDG